MMTEPNDLEAFFKKSKKGKKKKTGVQDVNSLAKRLEKTAKRQEELDREEEERRQRAKEEANFFQNVRNEDSEWHDFGESKDVDLAAVGIKDLELGQPEDEEVDENQPPAEQAKGWNVGAKEGEDGETQANEPPAEPQPQQPVPDKPRAYVPPSLRQKPTGPVERAPDVSSAFDFPSLEDADELEKQKREREKRAELRKLEMDKRREGPKSNALQENVANRDSSPSEPADDDKFTQHKANAYVPPWRRQQQAQPNTNITTENRFSQLDGKN